MKKYSARLIILLMLLLVIPCILHADTVRWEWSDAGANYYRWQLDGEDEKLWSVVDGDTFHVHTSGLDLENVYHFYLQSSLDGEHWSKSAISTVGGIKVPYGKRSHVGTRLSISPYSIAIFDFFNGHEIEGAKYLTLTDYAASVDAELYWKLKWPVSFHVDGSYTIGLKGETVIPNAADVHLVRIGGGADFAVASEKVAFFLGINGGELISINAHGWNPDSYLGVRMLLEFNISEKFLIGVQSRVALSYQKSTEPLLSSHTWLVDPLALTVTYRF